MLKILTTAAVVAFAFAEAPSLAHADLRSHNLGVANGQSQNGLRTNGLRTNGLRTNGLRTNGLRTNGIETGATVNGRVIGIEFPAAIGAVR